jgi:[acyl-carrier-protein] S-malonyltransferase
MGLDLCDRHPVAREVYEQASEVLGYDLLRACRDEHSEFSDTLLVQPAVLTHSVACWRVLAAELDAAPVTFAGHSLGEVSALVAAEALEFPRAVALVRRRAELMAATAKDGAMAAVFGLDAAIVARVCEDMSTPGHVVTVANRNSPDQVVISGHRAAVLAAAQRLDADGVVRVLAIAVAAHSPLMRSVVKPFQAAVAEAGPRDCAVPVLSAVDGRLHEKANDVARMLVGQLTSCVDWPLALDGLAQLDVETVIEVGPKTVLRDLTRSQRPDVTALSCGTAEDVVALRGLFASDHGAAGVTRSAAEEFLLACLRLAVGTPSPRTHTRATFERTVDAPYRLLREELGSVRGGDGVVDAGVLRRVATRSVQLLHAKGLPNGTVRALLADAAAEHGVGAEIAQCLV